MWPSLVSYLRLGQRAVGALQSCVDYQAITCTRHESRKTMRHQTHGNRVIYYGTEILVTFSPLRDSQLRPRSRPWRPRGHSHGPSQVAMAFSGQNPAAIHLRDLPKSQVHMAKAPEPAECAAYDFLGWPCWPRPGCHGCVWKQGIWGSLGRMDAVYGSIVWQKSGTLYRHC